MVSLPELSGHFDTACHQYCVLFSSCWDVLAFEGSSHCLGWPVLLYRKRPQASLNCILVDDNGTVIYRGVATSAPPMQNHTEVRMDRVEKVKVFKLSMLKYFTFSGAGGNHGVPLGLLWPSYGQSEVRHNLWSQNRYFSVSTCMMPSCQLGATQGPAIRFLAPNVFHLADHLHMHRICLYRQGRETQ